MDQATIETLNRRLREIPAPAPLGVYRGKEVYAVSTVLEYWLDIAIEPDTLPAAIRDEFIASLLKRAERVQHSQGQDCEKPGLLVCGEMPALRQIATQMLRAAADIISKNKGKFPGRLEQIVAAESELRREILKARA